MEWISIKDKLPLYHGEREEFALAFHSIHGVGVAWFWILEYVEEEEEEYNDKYLCSYHFIKNTKDGNDCIDEEEDQDIFLNSPHFSNLGTITHWMPLPPPPKV